jgi:hypothetical protein
MLLKHFYFFLFHLKLVFKFIYSRWVLVLSRITSERRMLQMFILRLFPQIINFLFQLLNQSYLQFISYLLVFIVHRFYLDLFVLKTLLIKQYFHLRSLIINKVRFNVQIFKMRRKTISEQFFSKLTISFLSFSS